MPYLLLLLLLEQFSVLEKDVFPPNKIIKLEPTKKDGGYQG
jgi:hypothetical protein